MLFLFLSQQQTLVLLSKALKSLGAPLEMVSNQQYTTVILLTIQ